LGKVKLTYIELMHLKNTAIKAGANDWISMIDTTLSYEENKRIMLQNFGHVDTDNEMMAKYKNYEEMANNQIYGGIAT